MRKLIHASILAFLAAALTSDSAPAQSVTPSCPDVAPQTTFQSGTLDTSAIDKLGTVFDPTGSGAIRLANKGGLFEPLPGGADVSKDFDTAAAADFNGDGQIDLIAGQDSSGATQVYLNGSSPLPASPTFNDSTIIPAAAEPHMSLGAGDFDGDGLIDFVRLNVDNGSGAPNGLQFFRNTGNVGVDPQFAAGVSALTAAADLAELVSMNMPDRGSNLVVADYNGDRKLDLIISSARGIGGSVHKFRNDCTPNLTPPLPADPLPVPCTDAPTFSYDGDLISDVGIDSGNPIIAYGDFNGDSYGDLVVGGTVCCGDADKHLRLWFGQSAPPGTLDLSDHDKLEQPFANSRFLLAGDFSLDGRLDLMVGVSSGRTLYFENSGTSHPLSNPLSPADFPTKDDITTPGSPMTSFGFGLAFDYDNDGSIDFLLTDGTGPAKTFANSSAGRFVASGTVTSDFLDLGLLSDTEMIITTGRLRVTYNDNGGTTPINFYMGNTNSSFDFIPAVTACPAPDADWLCVTFPKQFGREIRWKAELTTPDELATPTIEKVEVKFDYTEAVEHYRAGVVVQDGVAYVGAFRQPGQRGKFYAVSADLTQLYWEAGEILDREDQPRNIFTANGNNVTTPVLPAVFKRLEFRYTGDITNDAELLFEVGVFEDTVNNWARTKRFGVGNTGIGVTHLGAIETSTPAVVGPPGLTPWYVFADAAEQGNITSFVANNADRVPLVLVGSKDGMLHAFRNDATLISDTRNGYESWAYVPFEVAASMNGDFFASGGTGSPAGVSVSNYPDGSTTVADVRFTNGGPIRTAAVFGLGGGGDSFTVLDITETVDPGTDAVSGPEVKWSVTPPAAGNAAAKPTIIRTDSGGGTERFLVVIATGPDIATEPNGPYTRGREVVAYDIGDGSVVWQVRTACPVTTNISAFETDDVGETGPPVIDGFIDRVVFGDKCGYLYKVDAATGADEGAVPVVVTPVVPDTTGMINALFYTGGAVGLDATATAAGPSVAPLGLGAAEERPIVGTIAARTDSTGDIMLFFGTGGLETFDTNYHNEFLVVKAKDGSVRSRLIGDCDPSALPPLPDKRNCEKFYGGVTTTAEEFVFAGTFDPLPADPSCDQGKTIIRTASLDAGAGTIIDDTEGSGGSLRARITRNSAAISKSIYARGGAIYLTTQAGEIVRIGTSNAPVAGAETASGVRNRMGRGQGGGVGTEQALSILAWRQIF